MLDLLTVHPLAECDRSFTRSDALAKHMRTVHETEALRPSDPVPKSQQPTGKSGKLKIIIKTPNSHSGADDGADGSMNGEEANAEYFTALTSELFSARELALPVDELYRKCYWEAKWSGEIGDALKKECKKLEEEYRKEWLEKEVLLGQVVKSEVDWHERREAILSGVADVQLSALTAAAAAQKAPTENQANGTKEEEEEKPAAPEAVEAAA